MHTWNWQTWQELPYLTCSLLQEWQHGFFSQHFGSRSPAELSEILSANAAVYRTKQVHGNTVLSASEIEPEKAAKDQPPLPDADGLVTQQANQSVWVCSADCTPALIADAETGQVAAVHAGWRGTSLKIVPLAIARLQSQGSQLQNLRIAMGPAIAGEVYQVSTTVAAQVGATLLAEPLNSTDPIAVLDSLKQMPDSPILDDPQAGRARLDVRRVNQLQLEHLGISPEQISIAPYCTYQNPDLFFSYRRTHQKQVQWSGMVSGRGL
jgi:polyphenol oxidase